MNNNGFQSSVWGPPAWAFLHFVAGNYTPEKERVYKRFFTTLGDVLPCKHCRANYKEKLKATMRSRIFKSRRAFAKWWFDFHNLVNKHLKKPIKKNFDSYYNKNEIYRGGMTCKPFKYKGYIYKA